MPCGAVEIPCHLEQMGAHLVLIEEFAARFRATAQLLERVAGQLDAMRTQAIDGLVAAQLKQ